MYTVFHNEAQRITKLESKDDTANICGREKDLLFSHTNIHNIQRLAQKTIH